MDDLLPMKTVVHSDDEVVQLVLNLCDHDADIVERILGIEFAYDDGSFPSDWLVVDVPEELEGTCDTTRWRESPKMDPYLPTQYPALAVHQFYDSWDRTGPVTSRLLVYEHMSEFSKTDIYAFVKDFISAEHIEEVLAHNFQSGGGVGVYILATEYEIAPEVGATGHVVLASHNYFNGDADYAESTSEDTAVFSSLKDLVKAADKGDHSIGAVFGTREWVWK